MDTVFIEALEVETRIGVHDWERRASRTLRFDVELVFDCRPAAVSDDIADALDYAAVCTRLRDIAAASADRLLETLAERCCRALLNEFDADEVMLKITKTQAVAQASAVGVVLRRTRTEGVRGATT